MFVALDDVVTVNTDIPIAYLIEGVGHLEGAPAEKRPFVKVVYAVSGLEPLFIDGTTEEVLAKLAPMEDPWQQTLPMNPEESGEDYLNRITVASRS